MAIKVNVSDKYPLTLYLHMLLDRQYWRKLPLTEDDIRLCGKHKTYGDYFERITQLEIAATGVVFAMNEFLKSSWKDMALHDRIMQMRGDTKSLLEQFIEKYTNGPQVCDEDVIYLVRMQTRIMRSFGRESSFEFQLGFEKFMLERLQPYNILYLMPRPVQGDYSVVYANYLKNLTETKISRKYGRRRPGLSDEPCVYPGCDEPAVFDQHMCRFHLNHETTL